MRVVLLVATALLNLGFGQEITYSQNNLSEQNRQAGFKKKHPVVINADLLFGTINSQPTSFCVVIKEKGQEQSYAFQSLKTNPEFGFRFGIGVGLKNKFNLSIQ